MDFEKMIELARRKQQLERDLELVKRMNVARTSEEMFYELCGLKGLVGYGQTEACQKVG